MALLSRLQKRSVLLLGSARSGTTWLAEAINYDGRYRFIFEPARNVYTRKDCPFDDISPVPSRQSSSKYKHFYDQILAGHIRNSWTDTWSPTRYSRRKLIKEVRVNLALDWFDTNYPDAQIIFMIRNPYAVTASRLRTDGGWEDYFTRERRIVNRRQFFNAAQMKALNSKKLSAAEQFFLSWCIENLLPLRLLKSNHHVHIVFFEDLVRQPQQAFSELFDYLGDEIRPGFWAKAKLRSKSSAKKGDQSKRAYLERWQRQLPTSTIKKLRRLAELFEVDRLYPNETLPDKAAFDSLIGTTAERRRKY